MAAVSLFLLILIIHFIASFILAWIFFVKREMCSNWQWYFRHLAGAIIGFVFAVIVFLGVYSLIFILPKDYSWERNFVETIVVEALIFTCIWLLAKWLFPAAKN